jgi:predicted extracellular nuclease
MRINPRAVLLRLMCALGMLLSLSTSLLGTPSSAAAAAPTDLIISEYIEGNVGNIKAIELYNGTGADINLATLGYRLQIFANGGTSAGFNQALTGTIADGDTFVIGHSYITQNFPAIALDLEADLNYNGDDAVALLKRVGNVDSFVDVIGQIGYRPTGSWSSNGISTADQSLRRNQTVCAGDPDGSDAFDPSMEWSKAATANDLSGLGSHTIDCGPVIDLPPSILTTVPANTATGVRPDSTITLSFSEDVTLAADPLTINCSLSGAVAYSLSGGPRSYSFAPNGGFAAGETCAIVVDADKVTDLDGTIDPMASDYSFGFTILTDTCLAPNAVQKIGAVQGAGAATPAPNTAVTVQGVVVANYEQNSGPQATLNGFYIQDAGDNDPESSDGVFIFTGTFPAGVKLGDFVQVAGTVKEYQGQTQIQHDNAIAPLVVSLCLQNAPTITPTDIAFPVASDTYLERFEGMLVRVPQSMTVSEIYYLGRFGQILLSANGRLQQPTSLHRPGPEADALAQANALRSIMIDDGVQRQNPDPLVFGRGGNPLSASNTLRGGDTVRNLQGVLTYTWGGHNDSPNMYRIQPVGVLNTSLPAFETVNTRPTSAPSVGGELKVVSFNVLNYFLTIDNNQEICGPVGHKQTCRGADEAAELTRQRAKTLAALVKLDADVIGVMEMENTPGVEPLADLVAGLNATFGAGTYAYVNTGVVGTDVIRNGIIYRTSKVELAGAHAILDSSYDPKFLDTQNRPVIAQTFSDKASGEKFTIAVNHLKSKGSACTDIGDPDLGDGQGNCNLTRKAAAEVMARWLATDPTNQGTDRILIIGDLNSQPKEDPIDVLESAGYINLINKFQGPNAYGYVFGGLWGYLDHALASPSIEPFVTGAIDYHINADEPSALDYDMTFKSKPQHTLLYNADEFRASDHDPVMIGLKFTPNTEPDAAPTVATTVPAHNATAVEPDSTITITFSEDVTLGAQAIELNCSVSGAVAYAQSGGPRVFIFNPNSDFAAGELCTVKVLAAKVTDLDGSIDPMASDYSFSFTVLDAGCLAPATVKKIGAVQGAGATTPTPNTAVTVQGVVVANYEQNSAPQATLNGFYIQDAGDANPETSDGIFVQTAASPAGVKLGDFVQVTGTVKETQGQTQIQHDPAVAALAVKFCLENAPTIAATEIAFPVASNTYLERFEGMLVRVPQSMTVSEVYALGRFGQILLSANGRLQQPTNLHRPGPQADALAQANALRSIMLDDGVQRQNPEPIVFGRESKPLSASNTLRGGDTVRNLQGVLTYTWGGHNDSPNMYRIQPVGALNTSLPVFEAANARPSSPPALNADLKVVSFNVLNYFLTIDNGEKICGPAGKKQTCRGADTPEELARQRAKTLAALAKLDADVIGVMEMENTPGVEPLADLVAGLNATFGAGSYAYVNTGVLGSDVIRNGIIYRTSKVELAGAHAILDSRYDPKYLDDQNRPVLAQTFSDKATGEKFTIAVNHLKSKGSACTDIGDPDKNDGQGNCNQTRKAAAEVMARWLASDPTKQGTDKILIIGDLNSYAKEDPIVALETAGYTNLINKFQGPNAYGYVFGGLWGYLDHALASKALEANITGANYYHINADEPPVLDYDMNFKSTNQHQRLYRADEFRSSDHDPVVIGLRFSKQPEPSVTKIYLPIVQAP